MNDGKTKSDDSKKKTKRNWMAREGERQHKNRGDFEGSAVYIVIASTVAKR